MLGVGGIDVIRRTGCQWAVDKKILGYGAAAKHLQHLYIDTYIGVMILTKIQEQRGDVHRVVLLAVVFSGGLNYFHEGFFFFFVPRFSRIDLHVRMCSFP